MRPEPTRRAVVDIGRKCNVNCQFCYYHHLGDLSKQEFKTKDEILCLVHEAIDRGNAYIDFTGGEPTIHPDMPEIVAHLRNDLNVKSCIITNALAGRNTLTRLLDAGIDDFLVSLHGCERTHDAQVREGARKDQIRFMTQCIGAGLRFRTNTVLTKWNQDELANFAGWVLQFEPRIVNFINFNPHGDWSRDTAGILGVVANLRELEPNLNYAIDMLENHGVGVNLRYYPMCRIDDKYRRCVCNDLHVAFDPYEWDYEIKPKTVDQHYKWGVATSSSMEWKSYPCDACRIRQACGGINGAFNMATMGSEVDPVNDCQVTDFYHYRQHNVLTLQERV